MNPHFSRISCWIYNHPVPPIPSDAIIYYESSWDIQTNKFINDNLQKINDALSTYPSGYCRFQLYYVSQPQMKKYESSEDADNDLMQNATIYHNATSPFEGIISCALLQDKNHIDPTTQRVLTFNLEDCTQQAILTAIRYMSYIADEFKDAVEEKSGSISDKYRHMWQVDLATECKELYDTAYLWLSGKYEMCFTQPILKFDESTHCLWFVDKKSNLTERFLANNDLMAQAYYILVWNHSHEVEGVTYEALGCIISKKNNKEREKKLKEEFKRYYKIFNTKNKLMDGSLPEEVENSIDNFFSSSNLNNARSRIKNAFINHEKRRVHLLYANKVASYFSIDLNTGKIPVKNKITTIILPESLRENLK